MGYHISELKIKNIKDLFIKMLKLNLKNNINARKITFITNFKF